MMRRSTSTPLRVLVTTDFLENGGAERQMALTVANLPERWDVHCFSVGGGPFEDYVRERGVSLEVAQRRWRFDPVPFLRLWRRVAVWRPQIVHSWGYMTTLAGFPAFRAFGIPFIDGSIRTGDVRISRDLRCRLGFDRASLVVANSFAGLRSAGVSSERGRVIRNGFDASRIPPSPPARTDHRFTIVMAARMMRPKDQAALVAAVRILLEDVGPSRFRCVLMGDGPDRVVLESANRDLVHAGVLEFACTTDVVSQLLISDCGVLMTAREEALEGCSNSILEYMACGLPVVCSRGGGTDELVAHGGTGFLVTPGRPRELALRLRWILEHPEEAKGMRRMGAEIVRRDYSVSAMIRATERVYLEAIDLA